MYVLIIKSASPSKKAILYYNLPFNIVLLIDFDWSAFHFTMDLIKVAFSLLVFGFLCLVQIDIFTFMHLADALSKTTYSASRLYIYSSVCVFLGIEPTTFALIRDALPLSHRNTSKKKTMKTMQNQWV